MWEIPKYLMMSDIPWQALHSFLCFIIKTVSSLTFIYAARPQGDSLPGARPAHRAAAAAALHQVDVGRLRGARHEPTQQHH